jgi:hypothetical protein
MPAETGSQGLTAPEIIRVVNRYIGFSGGYLGLPDRFTHASHADFYAEYCDLAVDLSPFEGTTRETFIAALSSLPPRGQAKVLRGVIERFPPDQNGGPDTRHGAHAEVLTLIERLESGPLIESQTPQITSEVVLRALQDAENLISNESSGPTSAVDRVHTVLHGYLIAVCDGAGIVHGSGRPWSPSSESWRLNTQALPTWVHGPRTSRPSRTPAPASLTPCSRFGTRGAWPTPTPSYSESPRLGSSSTSGGPSSTTSTPSSRDPQKKTWSHPGIPWKSHERSGDRRNRDPCQETVQATSPQVRA